MSAVPPAQTRHSPLIEGALFLVTGLGITVLNLIFYLGFIHLLGLSPPVAAILSFICATPPHFISYSKLVFRTKGGKGTFWRYGLTLLISCFLNVVVLSFFWAWLLADPLPAQLLGLIIAVLSNYLLLKFFVFRHSFDWGRDSRAQIALNLTALIIGFAAIYISFLAISLYTAPELFADDWRHYRDYFLDKSYLSALLDRQNGHPMIFPNIVMYHNLWLFGGQMSTLAIVNLTLFALAGAGMGYTLYRIAISFNFGLSTALAMFVSGLVVFYLLSAPNVQFWGLPLHNHAVMAAAVLSVLFASGTLGRLDRPSIFLGWFFFALIAAGSFSTGASVALLGVIGATLNRSRLPIVALYAIVGIIITTISLGLLFSSRDVSGANPASLFDIAALAEFMLAFIGAPWLNIIEGSRDLAMARAVRFGILAIILFFPVAIYGLRLWFRRDDGGLLPRVHFAALLLSLYALSIPPQIYLGRIDSFGSQIALAPRFATWAALFWYALVWSYLLIFLQVARRMRGLRWLPSLGVASLAAAAVWVNYTAVDQHVRFKVKFHADRLTQIAINQDDRPTRTTLWGQDHDATQAVIGDMKKTGRNLFARDWPWRQGEPYPNLSDINLTCPGWLQFRTTDRPDEMTLRGWAFRTEAQAGALHHLYVVGPDGNVRGHAKPVFGKVWDEGLYAQARPPAYKSLHAVPGGVFESLPGISGHIFGNVRLSSSSPDATTVNQPVNLPGYRIVGEDSAGRACELLDPRKISK